MTQDFQPLGHLDQDRKIERVPNHCLNCTLRGSPQISKQHAESLIALLKWHRLMIAEFHEVNFSDKRGSEKHLTVGYCNQLIEALTVKKGNNNGKM